MNSKGQFFVLGMIIGLVVIVSIINALSIPYEFSVSLTENERTALEKYDIMKTYLVSSIEYLDKKWSYFSIRNKQEFKIRNNCSIKREIPWELEFDFNDKVDENSIRLIGENGEIKSQVLWINVSAKKGKLFFYDSIMNEKDYNIYFNKPFSKDNLPYQKADYNPIKHTKNSTYIKIETDYYTAIVDLSQNGIIDLITSKPSNKKILEDAVNVKDDVYQSFGGTATLLDESYGPVFSYLKIRSAEFGSNRTIVLSEYFFFNDRIKAFVNATYRLESYKLEITNKISCDSQNYNVSLGNKNINYDICAKGIMDDKDYSKENAYVSVYNENLSYSIVSDYNLWNSNNYLYSTKTLPAKYITFSSNSSSKQKYVGEIAIIFHTPKTFNSFGKTDFLEETCIEIISNKTSQNIIDEIKENNNYIISENIRKGFTSSFDENVYQIKTEQNAMQADWYGTKKYVQNFTITENLGVKRTNFKVKVNISGDPNFNPQIKVPSTIEPSSLEVYDVNQKIPITVEWIDYSTRTANIKFLANLSENEKKGYELRYY